MNLWNLNESESADILEFSRDIQSSFAGRLQEFGFQGGETVTCIKKTPFGGPRVYQICDGIFSLEKDIAENIFIKRV